MGKSVIIEHKLLHFYLKWWTVLSVKSKTGWWKLEMVTSLSSESDPNLIIWERVQEYYSGTPNLGPANFEPKKFRCRKFMNNHGWNFITGPAKFWILGPISGFQKARGWMFRCKFPFNTENILNHWNDFWYSCCAKLTRVNIVLIFNENQLFSTNKCSLFHWVLYQIFISPSSKIKYPVEFSNHVILL